MLYKKNNTPKLDMELYKNPTIEYRVTPFWAWNCKLEKEELERPIGYPLFYLTIFNPVWCSIVQSMHSAMSEKN